MSVKLFFLWLAMISLLTAGLPGWSQSAVVWDGPDLTFNHPADVGTGVRDELTPDVWLTRDVSQGLFNVATEGGYTHNLSPQDTEWAYGLLVDYASLSYATWESWNNKYPPGMVGQPAVLHLISENIYLALTFTSWGGSGGEFSYERSTPSPVPEPPVWVLCGLSGMFALIRIVRKKPSVPA